MPYLKSAYGDHNHFTSARVSEFRKRFKRASWHQTVRIPAETVGIATGKAGSVNNVHGDKAGQTA